MGSLEVAFPAEIINLIFDDLFSDEKNLSTIALVTRGWRHRVNAHRFSDVWFESSWGGEDNVSRPLYAFKALLDADASTWPPHERLARYFSYIGCPLELTDWRERAVYETSPCIEDGSMAAVFAAVFMPPDELQPTDMDRTLELWTTHPAMGPHRFDEFTDNFKDTIYSICSNNGVSHLSLSLFESVPAALLLNCSTVDSLTLNEVDFIRPIHSDVVTTDNCMAALTFLSLRRSFSFMELAVSFPATAMPALRSIEIILHKHWEDKVIGPFTHFFQSPIAQRLTAVSFVVEQDVDVTAPVLQTASFTALETLEISCHTKFSFFRDAPHQPVLLSVLNLMPHLLPRNINLFISIDCWRAKPIPASPAEIAGSLHRRIHHPALLPVLERLGTLGRNARANITVEMAFLKHARGAPEFIDMQKRYKAMMRHHFAKFTGLPWVRLTVYVPDD